jgi:gluconate 2-dehydrogenase gamma chain
MDSTGIPKSDLVAPLRRVTGWLQPRGFMAEKDERLPNPDTRIPNSQPQGFGRRDLLKVLGAVPAAALAPLASAKAALPRPTDPVREATASTAYQPKVLDPHEWKTIQVLSDIIIPADDRSGSATQAGVPEFIDDWLDFKEQTATRSEDGKAEGASLLPLIRGGIIWLDAVCNWQFNHDFVDCAWAQQKQILDRIAYPKEAAPEDAAGVVFFNHLRDLVVSGFFSSEMGVKDLPYLGNQMVSEWNGCPLDVLAKLELNKLVPGK